MVRKGREEDLDVVSTGKPFVEPDSLYTMTTGEIPLFEHRRTIVDGEEVIEYETQLQQMTRLVNEDRIQYLQSEIDRMMQELPMTMRDCGYQQRKIEVNA